MRQAEALMRQLPPQGAALLGAPSDVGHSNKQLGTATLDRPPCEGASDQQPSADEAARVRLAAMADTPPAMLEALARDPALTVRAAVAMNPAAPSEAEMLLAGDADERIRMMLGRKLASLMPSLAAPDRKRMQESALKTLNALVEDEAVRVRAAIAAVVRDMPDVPRSLILRLARDEAVSVHEPVIRLSPLLSAGDLLGLLSRPEVQGAAAAIAGRPDLDESVCDAIARSTDDSAICALLENGSAAIREATLDSLIARAASREVWHEPLVRRPGLTDKAAHALSEIVTTHLLTVLADRGDLNATLTNALKRRLHERIATKSPPRQVQLSTDEAMADARVLFEEGQLTEDGLLEAAGHGQLAMAQAMLAVAANVASAAVERAVTLRNAKGLVSLAWKAGFSMRSAVTLQTLLARVAPAAALRATGSGGYPLSADEMKYQLELLVRSGR